MRDARSRVVVAVAGLWRRGGPAGAGLLPGMYAQLRVALGAEDNIVTLPETAITYSLHGNTVFVI